MIRDGILSDIEAVVKMSREFWDKTIYKDPFCDDTCYVMTKECLKQGLFAVLEVDDKVEGFACGIAGTLLGNASVNIGTEVAWWINPDHRGSGNGVNLLEYMEDKAQNNGMKYWNMIFMQSSMPGEVEKIYQKMGYIINEVTYTKVL